MYFIQEQRTVDAVKFSLLNDVNDRTANKLKTVLEVRLTIMRMI